MTVIVTRDQIDRGSANFSTMLPRSRGVENLSGGKIQLPPPAPCVPEVLEAGEDLSQR